MKKIGIVGGLGPESTLEYYKILVKKYNQIKGGVASPALIIESLDLQAVSDLMKNNEWDQVLTTMIQAANNLIAAGAQIIILATNSPHVIFDELEQQVSVPMISIMDATVQEVQKAGLKRVGLLGTKYTMNGSFYPKTFGKYDIEIITPSPEDQEIIDEILWKELVHRILEPESKKKYLAIIDKLQANGAEGIVLGCTEIPLLIKQKDCKIPVFDTTRIHAMAALSSALED
ncbi:MAG: amino acid racemase [Candidatus Heimdallarchaeota archaeon]|nr:amino acid racemase [Candidatus Heimdallarchaeota archaeon]